MFNEYPYRNLTDLNLDYLFNALRKIEKLVQDFVTINALKYANPIQWNITSQYEKNTIVIDPQSGTAYISVQPVPVGVALTNTDYWTVVFDLEQFVTKANGNFTLSVEPLTTLTATFATPIHGWVIWGGNLYRALTNITAGDQYVIDSNIKRTTVEEVVGYIEDLKTTNKNNLVESINELYDELAIVVGVIGDLNDLNTTDKTSIVNAINSILVTLSSLVGDLNNLNTTDKTSIVNAINSILVTLSSLVGDLNNLNTTDKTNIVNAINEVVANIGDLNNLNTSDKTSIVNAINAVINDIADTPTIIDVTSHGVVLDGVTDNTTALQTLLNDCAGKKILYVPDGVCITAGLTVPSNTHIILDGELKLKDNTPEQLLYCLRGENIIIEGHGTLNGNKSMQSSTLAIACILFGGASPIKEYDVNNVLIKGITIKNALYWGASLIGDNNTFEGVTFADNNYMSFIGPYSKNGTFRNCEAYGVVNDWGLGFYGGVDGGLIDNCVAHNNNQTGLGALSDAAQTHASTNIKIVNCTCYENEMGIAVGGGDAGSNVVIANNYCYDADTGTQFDVGGIGIFNQSNVEIHDNILINNDNQVGSGVLIFGDCSNVNVHHNTIVNVDSIGVRLYGTIAANINIDSNDINADTAIAYYNAYSAVVKNTISNNNIKGNMYIPYAGVGVVTMSNNLINTAGSYLRTQSTGYLTFTPDGTQTVFTFSTTDVRLFGSFKTIALSPRNDYGGYRFTFTDSSAAITFAVAPSSGYGSIIFDYVITSTLED